MNGFLHNITALLHNHDPLLQVGMLLLLGFLGGMAANRVGFPRVSGYIVTGMLLSPSVSGFFREELIRDELSIITDIALGIIAFSIGGSLVVKQLKKLYSSILWINFTQAIGAFLATTLLISLAAPYILNGAANFSFWQAIFPMALIIGAISAATAPAAVLAIVHEHRAKGPFTTTLLSVVALDDATAIVFYSFAIALAQSLMTQSDLSWQTMVYMPATSILTAIFIGIIPAILMKLMASSVKRRETMLGVVVGFIFLITGLANNLDASPLIANMVFGFFVVNFIKHAHDLFSVVEMTEEMIFSLFFTLAGAHLNIGALTSGGWLIIGLIVMGRFTGKLYGTRLGASIAKAPSLVRRYLGLALLPKAGVTVGLVLLAKNSFGDSPLADIMVNAVLGSVIINELIAPPLVKYALVRSGEAEGSKTS
ncbi:MAG: cation:proton antiporter [Proteobacteria bacterium]|nr:cation:proton antiporter [Pseudomonadota bacterium]